MAVTILGPGYGPLYGQIEPPIIPGWTFISKSNDWFKASDGTRNFVVGEGNDSWLLWEVEYRKEFASKRNHEGMGMKKAYPDGLSMSNADVIIPK